ncbi:MAG: hypothetical protein JNG89_18815, partial [Planctomycetaceae bacterium]|nr:hypothetical protein [Planctomycetaceae bacterium]
ALFLIPVALIIARLYYVQGVIADRYVSTWDRTEETLESMPARDGRIVTADGQVLAYDHPRFDIALHYRWLEEPPNRDWLETQARQLLKPAQRRDAELLKRARDSVVQQRAQLHADLAAAAGCSSDELQSSLHRVQGRIERIYAHVFQRQAERDAVARAGPVTPPGTNWSDRAWSAVKTALTTEPVRARRDPLVIQEQLAAHVVVEDVPLSAVAAIESAPARFPGVEVRRMSRRVYPAGRLASHIVGARTVITSDELADLASGTEQTPDAPTTGDRIGRSGIERTHSQQLRGQKGLKRIVRDRRGQLLRTEIVRPPVDGADVVLSFDSRLQNRAESLLDNVLNPPPKQPVGDDAESEQLDAPPPVAPPQGGCIVAIDVRSGRILAAAAAPRFDANLIVDHDAAAWNAAVADPRQPFFPRITQMTIPPGSVFKTLTAVAVIESGLIDPDASFHCQGYLDEPDRNRCLIYRHYGAGHGDVTLDDALCRSCNVYFFDAARKIGPQSIHDWAARFGLGMPTGVDIPGERAGLLPDPRSPDAVWYPGTTLQYAIGQAALAVTPLQVAQMMAAVANDGYLVTPTFVRPSVGPADRSGSDIQLTSYGGTETRSTRRAIPGLSPGTLQRVRAGLRLVVEDDHGTGKRVRHSEVSIAGKTGTAETGGGKPDHAWFAGYVPADEPRVAFVVVLEHGGSGGHVAGPIAHNFVQALLDFGVIQRDRAREE